VFGRDPARSRFSFSAAPWSSHDDYSMVSDGFSYKSIAKAAERDSKYEKIKDKLQWLGDCF